MATKCCTKLEVAEKMCPIVFEGHPSNFMVARLKLDRTGRKASEICLHPPVVDLGQVGRWERGTHQPRSGGESRRAVTWSDPSFPNPRTVSTVVESLLIILCLYCIYKCIRRPHNIWRCRTGFLPCARTVLVRCFVYFDNFSEVNFCVLCCSVREHTFGFDSCGVVGPRVSGMWTV